MKRGIFITIEGPDGSGKSTQLLHIKTFFEKEGLSAIFTREPGGTKISERIRSVILDDDNSNMNPKAEAFLYAASRAQHVSEIIKPSLEEGKNVICDRYIDSSIVYQGIARQLGPFVEELNKWGTDNLTPDLTILLVVDPITGKKRRKNRTEDRIESEKISFHEEVYKGYLSLSEKKNDRYILIDGTKSKNEISNIITEAIKKVLITNETK